MKKSIKIRVGVPSYSGRTFPRTAETIQALSSFPDIVFDTVIVPGMSINLARNVAVSGSKRKLFQKHNFDYFLSVDADVSFSVSSVLMLIDRDVDVVAAAYNQRSSITGELCPRLTCGKWNRFPGDIRASDFLDTKTTGLVEVDTVGLGCTLIKKRVFELLEYPYFRENIVVHDDEALLLADDLSFSLNCQRRGIRLYCDADVRAAHDAGNEYR